jgi:hypothetical protein
LAQKTNILLHSSNTFLQGKVLICAQIRLGLSSIQWVIVYNPIQLLGETDHHLQSSTEVTTLTDHRGRPAEARMNTTSEFPASVTFDPRDDNGHSGKI